MRTPGALILTSVGIVAAIVAIAIASSEKRVISFFSAESKTLGGAPVANSISLSTSGSKDIWMMNQSHHGASAPGELWDRVAIVVDRDAKTAKFLQLEPGKLEWSEGAREVDFKVSCRVCHSNGPRAIRPLSGLDGSPLSWLERVQTLKWNMRIKRYGRLTALANNTVGGHEREIPFELPGTFAHEELKVPVCIVCHKESGVFAHGTLTRQNSITIKHMVESGNMPPLGIPLVKSQRRELQRFLNGL